MTVSVVVLTGDCVGGSQWSQLSLWSGWIKESSDLILVSEHCCVDDVYQSKPESIVVPSHSLTESKRLHPSEEMHTRLRGADVLRGASSVMRDLIALHVELAMLLRYQPLLIPHRP
jgi:hypothetical protein